MCISAPVLVCRQCIIQSVCISAPVPVCRQCIIQSVCISAPVLVCRQCIIQSVCISAPVPICRQCIIQSVCISAPVPVCRQCIRRCLFGELSALGPGCRLPWMPVQLPVCSTAEDYQALLNYTRMFSRTHIVWDQMSAELKANKYYAALKRQVSGRSQFRARSLCYLSMRNPRPSREASAVDRRFRSLCKSGTSTVILVASECAITFSAFKNNSYYNDYNNHFNSATLIQCRRHLHFY